MAKAAARKKSNGTKATPQAKARGVLLLERLRKGTDYSVRTVWPGTENEIAIRVLSVTQIQEAQAAAWRRWEELGLEVNLYTSDDFYSEMSLQLMARALREADDPDVRLFEDSEIDDFRDAITADERTLLASEYYDLQRESNPAPEDLTEETVEILADAVKKKDLVRLSAFGSNTLAIYLLSTANQPST